MAEANKQEWHVPLPQSVMVERRGPIAIVTLNRPAKRNAAPRPEHQDNGISFGPHADVAGRLIAPGP
jgi:hypothetical protein